MLIYHNFCLSLQNVICQRLGRRVPSTGRDVDALLDRDPPGRTPPVAGQGPHPDGLALQPHHLSVLKRYAAAVCSQPCLSFTTNPRVFRHSAIIFQCQFGAFTIPILFVISPSLRFCENRRFIRYTFFASAIFHFVASIHFLK